MTSPVLRLLPGEGERIAGPPTTEAWYVVEGELSRLDGQRLAAPAGSFVLAPGGVPHAAANLGSVTARYLVICSPAGLEQWFGEVARLVEAAQPDEPDAGELSARRTVRHRASGMTVASRSVRLHRVFKEGTGMARDLEIDSNKLDWAPTKWPGIARKLLRNDATTGARTVLLRFDANTRLPRHMHPAGEEVTWCEAGFYLPLPPGSADDVFTDTGAILYVTLPRPQVDLE